MEWILPLKIKKSGKSWYFRGYLNLRSERSWDMNHHEIEIMRDHEIWKIRRSERSGDLKDQEIWSLSLLCLTTISSVILQQYNLVIITFLVLGIIMSRNSFHFYKMQFRDNCSHTKTRLFLLAWLASLYSSLYHF